MKRIALIFFLFWCSWGAQAFEFEWGGLKDDVHQQMTAAAIKCVDSGKKLTNRNCEKYLHFVNNLSIKVPREVKGMSELSAADMWFASTWPDDPLRELRFYNVVGWVKWLFRISVNECAKAKADKAYTLDVGLRCSSHYGDLQFLHSMEKNDSYDAMKTRDKMLEWAKLAYQVAINDVDSDGVKFSQQQYCQYFKNYKTNAENSHDGAKLDFVNALYHGDNDFPCDKKTKKWKLSTIFGFTCRFGSVNCKEWVGEGVVVARKNALGAILHMIQDSYAMGHTLRGVDKGIQHEYECLRISQFQEYGKQNHAKHSDADTWPAAASSCKENSPDNLKQLDITDGPVTASARVLEMFRDGAAVNDLEKYLREKVFVLTNEGKKPHQLPADSGVSRSFKKDS